MKTPSVAIARREAALEKIRFKIDKLEELIDMGKLESIPEGMKASTFAAWEDGAIGVYRFSRNALYESDDRYLKLHSDMRVALQRLEKLRAKANKKEKRSTFLEDKVEVLEHRVRAIANDYSIVKAELDAATKVISRLKVELNRAREGGTSITHLKSVKNLRRKD